MRLLGAFFAIASSLLAQTTFSTITGTVQDPTGAAVSGATVTATNTQTNVSSSVQTNEAGIYTLGQLDAGAYLVRAKAAGFKEFVAQNVTLVSRDLRRLDIPLEVGSVETSVEVSAGATLIETETARLADTKTAYVMKALPLNTRGLWAFLALAPNVLQAGGGSSTLRFAGSRGNQSNWSIDGVTFSDGVDNTQIGPMANYIESFQEIKIDMANNTAEFGTIGQVTIVSKSGANKLSGNIFDYYSTPWFRARNPFALERPAGIGHTPGGSIGGPVVLPKVYDGRNKSFFFYSFETSRGSAVNQLLNPTVPLPAWREGDFSRLTTTVFDPAGAAPFAGNRVPASRINPTSRRIQERFYPLPNFGDPNVLVSQNYREMKVRPRDPSTYFVVRGDHHFSERDKIFGRFTYQRAYNRTFEGNLPTIGRRFQRRDNRGVGGSYTHVFRPTVVNEFRYGFALNNNPVEGPLSGPEVVKDLGLTGLAPDLPNISGILKVNWAGVGLAPITQPDYTRPGFRNFLQDFQDHVSWFRGRHNMKAGFNLTRVEWDSLNANPNLFGSVTFSNRFTTGTAATTQGHPYADFLLGIPTNTARAFPPVRIDRSRWQYDFYFTDDWKVTQKLTLNLGVRYELHNPWREDGGLTSMFDIGTGQIVVEDGALSKVSPLFPRGYVGIVEAKTLGLPGRTLLRADRNNIAPRIGIAWRPWGPDTVLRAGYGIFFDVVPRNLNQGAIPFVLNEPGYTNPTVNPDVIFPRVFPSTGSGGPSTVGIPAAVNPNLKIPYSMQYNLTVEKQVWATGLRLSYIGTNTRQGDWSYDYNSPVPDTRAFIDKPRPFLQYPGISYFLNGAGHQYHALTAEAERHLARGLYFQSSWSWARDIGDLERGQSVENPFDRRRERAVALDIPTHRYNANFIYQLPFGRGRKFLATSNKALDLAVRGWEISGIYSYYSGQFLTPLWTGPDTTGTAFTQNRTAPVVTRRPDHLRDANLPETERRVTRWFDAAAFAAPRPGQFGTSAKGVIKGPSVNVWHAGFTKEFIFSDSAPRLRWEMTATNFFNHPNWSNPEVNITQAANVGVISGVGGVNGASTGDQPAQRAFRMGIRVEF